MRILYAFLVLFALLDVSCKVAADCKKPENANSAECQIVNATIDCTGGISLDSVIAAAEPIVKDLIKGVTKPNGSVDWAAIDGQLEQYTVTYGGCVMTTILSHYLLPLVGASEQELKAPRPSKDAIKTKLDDLRAKHWPKMQIKTRNGTY